MKSYPVAVFIRSIFCYVSIYKRKSIEYKIKSKKNEWCAYFHYIYPFHSIHFMIFLQFLVLHKIIRLYHIDGCG
jgi:hypothetical protein